MSSPSMAPECFTLAVMSVAMCTMAVAPISASARLKFQQLPSEFVLA